MNKLAFPKNVIRVSPMGNMYSLAHPGTDFGGVRINDPIVWSVGDGEVTKTGFNNTRGHYVEIYHPEHNLTSIYWHLKTVYVKEKQQVTKNTQVGYEGKTGNSNGEHLHFGLYKGKWKGYYIGHVDPLKHLYAYPEQKLYQGDQGNKLTRINYEKDYINVGGEMPRDQIEDYAKLGFFTASAFVLLKKLTK